MLRNSGFDHFEIFDIRLLAIYKEKKRVEFWAGEGLFRQFLCYIKNSSKYFRRIRNSR